MRKLASNLLPPEWWIEVLITVLIMPGMMTLIMLIMMGGMLMLIIVIEMAMLVMCRVIQLASSTSRSFSGGVLNALLMNFGFCAR